MNARQTVCVLMCLISEVCWGDSLATYLVSARGNNNDPLTGGIILSSPDPISRSTTLFNAFGTADVTMRADAGAVGVENSGSFTAPVLSTRFFPPTASATSSMFVTLSGPTPTVETSVNLHFDGFLSISNFPDIAFTAANGLVLFAYELAGAVFGLAGGVDQNGGFGLTNDFSSAIVNVGQNSFGVAGSGQTATVTVPVGVPILSRLGVVLSFDYLSSGFPGQSFFSGHFNDTFSYATSGPVFNLPAGYTVNGDGIVDNRFVSDLATPVPEPAGPLPLALGLLVLFVISRTAAMKTRFRSNSHGIANVTCA